MTFTSRQVEQVLQYEDLSIILKNKMQSIVNRWTLFSNQIGEELKRIKGYSLPVLSVLFSFYRLILLYSSNRAESYATTKQYGP